MPHVKVIAVSTSSAASGTASQNAQAAQSASGPITFALTPQQVLKVDYAESFASNIRLALIAPGTTGREVIPPPYAPATP